MKEVLIISKEFYPDDNANTNCLYRITEELQKRGYKVTVLSCIRYNENLRKQDKYLGCDVFRVFLTGQIKTDNIVNKFSKNPFSKILIYPLAKMLHWYTLGELYTKALKFYKALLKTHKFNFTISVYQVEENHNITCFLTSFKDNWFMVNLDSYLFNSKINSFKKLKFKYWERKASGIIGIDGVFEENQKNNFNSNNTTPKLSVPIPNLIINNSPCSSGRHDKIKLLYTGMFYDKIRRPEPLLEILEHLDKNTFSAEFYGKCCNFLRQEIKVIPPCVKLMGNVDTIRCKELVNDADILLNVSNISTNQIPSKIFEYIGSGKPIINIYFSNDDPSLKYLNLYPQIFNIKVGQQVDKKSLMDFIENAQSVSPDTLHQIYEKYSSDNVVKSIVDFIEKNI